jgi:hypothetical protein
MPGLLSCRFEKINTWLWAAKAVVDTNSGNHVEQEIGGGSKTGPPPDRSEPIQTFLVYCMGPPAGPRCHHWSAKKLDDLPEWDWYDISAHLKCTKCGSIGWVDTRPNWGEVINFNKGIGGRSNAVVG